MAWVVVVASDIVFNKFLLKLSPMKPEFRRGMFVQLQPGGLRLDAHRRGRLGAGVSSVALALPSRPYSPLVAIGLALVLPPIPCSRHEGQVLLAAHR